LLDRLASSGERRFWAHGNLPAAQVVAAARGLTPARTLLRLSRTGPRPSSVPVPPDVTIRLYRAADRRALLEVNALAFAGHAEQGSLDRERLDRITREEWFDPAGLFVAERAGKVVGFHWTKVVGGRGEIYVLGVHPDAQAEGLGRVLATHGLAHMAGRGIEQVDLYVEADNEPALGLYSRLGFLERARDVLYTAS
jgi:mycothiol synthase